MNIHKACKIPDSEKIKYRLCRCLIGSVTFNETKSKKKCSLGSKKKKQQTNMRDLRLIHNKDADYLANMLKDISQI